MKNTKQEYEWNIVSSSAICVRIMIELEDAGKATLR